MTHDKMQRNTNERPEQEKPEQACRPVQQSQASAPRQPDQRVTPGRRPLFRC
jgi:hypothetical protein